MSEPAPSNDLVPGSPAPGRAVARFSVAYVLGGVVLCLLGAAAVYSSRAWFSRPKVVVPASIARPTPQTRADEPPDDIARAHAALEKSRQEASQGRKQAAVESGLRAGGVVLLGQNLSRAAGFESKWGKNVPADGTPEAEEYRRERDELTAETAKVKGFVGDGKVLSALTRRENIAQFQSRLLYGALGLNDDQWRPMDRTLAAYYQEGYARNLNPEARPQTGIDVWQQQRASLSRRVFADIDAGLLPEQSSRFHKLFRAEDWMWASYPGPRSSDHRQ